MTKSRLFFLVALVTFLMPAFSNASSIPPTLKRLEANAKLIVSGECLSAAEAVKEVFGQQKKVIDYIFRVDKVVQGEGAKEGEEFNFTTFEHDSIIKRLVPGENYLLFMKQFSTGMWAYVAGDYGIFRVSEGAEGKKMVVNRFDNKGLMRGIKTEVTGVDVKGLKLEPATKEETNTMNQLRGPIEMDGMVKVLRRIDSVVKQKRLQKIETLQKLDKIEKVPSEGEKIKEIKR